MKKEINFIQNVKTNLLSFFFSDDSSHVIIYYIFMINNLMIHF